MTKSKSWEKKISAIREAWVKSQQGKHHCHCGCNKPIVIKKWHHHRGIPKYIHGHHQRGIKPPNWKGGWVSLNGYKMLYNPNHDINGDDREYIAEHRIVAEKILGRQLEKSEEVHHIDHDKLNNKPSNLIIMERVYHAEFHRREELLKYNRTASEQAKWGEAMKCFLDGWLGLAVPF